MNKKVLLAIGAALVVVGIALYIRRRKINSDEQSDAKAASGNLPRLRMMGSSNRAATSGRMQTFTCSATGETITTNSYDEYRKFQGRCALAGGGLNASWDYGDVLASSKTTR